MQGARHIGRWQLNAEISLVFIDSALGDTPGLSLGSPVGFDVGGFKSFSEVGQVFRHKPEL